MQTPYTYSFPTCLNTWMPFFTKIAIPPRFPLSLRCSKTWDPGISSLTADFISHVSYRQSTSNVCVPNSMYTFSKLIPATFWLPIDIPDFSHLWILSCFFFLACLDPFVRFVLYFSLPTVLFCSAFSFPAGPVLPSSTFFSYWSSFFVFSCALFGTFC